jgi:6-phosphogluconolactonase
MIKTFSNIEELSNFAAEKFVEIGNEAIKKHGKFTVALAGGSTPRSLYQLLVSDDFKNKIDWQKAFFFFGDERDVSPASNQSNFKMANEILFKPLEIQKTNIFRWQTEIINAVEVAEQYEKYVRKFFKLEPGEFPRFDLILLGMGDDGHTASLFPHTKVLLETSKIAAAEMIKKLNSNRLTLTFPTINNASNIIFLVSGENKAKTLQKVLEAEFQPEKFPSQGVKPTKGKLIWLIDEAAAENLEN